MSDDTEIFNGETIALIRGFREVRKAARDWEVFSSDAPGRVPIPAEDDVRSFRQYPVEVDPPAHTAYRDLVQPWFRRAHDDPDYVVRVRALVDASVRDLVEAEATEVVSGFSLPLQSRALSVLLGRPVEEAETWISWGTHAFRVAGKNIPEKAAVLEDYLNRQITRARASGGDDLFGVLAGATVQGRPLSDDEIRGITHLAFAGGRDTVIHVLTAALAHFAAAPDDLERIRADRTLALSATEELIRAASPLAVIGRTCKRSVSVASGALAPGDRIGLCWAEANHDPAIFDRADEILIDRKPNPHVGFGSGIHTCLGAPHARLLVRSLIESLADRVASVAVLSATPTDLDGSAAQQSHAYDALTISVSGVSAPGERRDAAR